MISRGYVQMLSKSTRVWKMFSLEWKGPRGL
jgi:hypothetical protein